VENRHGATRMTAILLALLACADAPPPTDADASMIPVVWLADLDPATVRSGTVGRWVFVPGSRADDVAGYWQVEARTVRITRTYERTTSHRERTGP